MDSSKINISFPDGRSKDYPKGVLAGDIAYDISPRLKKTSVGVLVNQELREMSSEIDSDAEIEFLSQKSKHGIQMARHSAAHILAQAVKRLFPEVQLGIGPVIENGYYYDFQSNVSFTPEHLLNIEGEMKNIINENHNIIRRAVSKEEAAALFDARKEEYKLEILRGLSDSEEITVYEQGEFVDLCRGPHIPSTGMLKAFKLSGVSGAYWRGEKENAVMQRVYGVAFSDKEELKQYLAAKEEAEKRNHRKLGAEMKLFMFSEEAPGMPFYLPKGQIIRNELEQYLRFVQNKRDYQEVKTPSMMNKRLWEQSGHWEHYHQNMYFSDVDSQNFALKPMNCPGHMIIYQNNLYSYRDLPLRLAEFGQVHRHEYSGALNGLLRVRTFCQDDAHIFVTPQGIKEELQSILDLIDEVYGVFGFQYDIELSTRPADSMGSNELWNAAEKALKEALSEQKLHFSINEGDGAFYGPKIDFHIRDSIGRSHQCATVQLDFQMPEKFNLHYIDHNNEKKCPVVIHRAVFGSIDRFLGILIEHYAGVFPLWLSPLQAVVIPVSQSIHGGFASEAAEKLRLAGIRVEYDSRNEKLGYKIREAQLNKIPYMLVVGDKEISEEQVRIRRHGEPDSHSCSIDKLAAMLQREILQKQLQSEEI
ncbi:threonine--tRNA ligase [Bacillus lacus]|uniref:Threonine--tRNA ligase n=1 Tax=Metabacillus lacus TaxID=1983721 RepID=A0A7X2J1R9_9BACI|nr:threonine--tRNA ligase [Metabacillus lacus]